MSSYAGVYIGLFASRWGLYRLIRGGSSNLQDGCIEHGYCDTEASHEMAIGYRRYLPVLLRGGTGLPSEERYRRVIDGYRSLRGDSLRI